MRYALYNEISVKKSGIANLVEASKLKGLKMYMLNPKCLKNYLGLSKVHKADLLMISHPRRFKQNDKFYNLFTDPVIEGLSDEYSTTTLEEPCWCGLVPSQTGHLFPVETENIHFTDLYELSFLLKNKMFKLCHSKKHKQMVVEVDEINKKYELFDEIELDKLLNDCIEYIIIELNKVGVINE